MAGKVNCMFCGQTETKAKEHVWPQWLQTLLGIEEAALQNILFEPDMSMRFERVAPYKALQFGKICAPCNNGWLSDMEEKTSTILKPILLKDQIEQTCLSKSEAEQLAIWTYKMALVLSAHSDNACLIPSRHYSQFYEIKALPQNVHVHIAVRKNSAGPDSSLSQNFGRADWDAYQGDIAKHCVTNSYRAAIGIKRLLLRVVYIPYCNFVLVPNHPFDDESARSLHPCSGPVNLRTSAKYNDPLQFERYCHFEHNPRIVILNNHRE